MITEAVSGSVMARAGHLDPSLDAVAVMLVADGPKRERVHGVADGGTILWKPHSSGARVEPFLTIQGTLEPPHAQDVLRAISESIGLFLGERTEMSELRGRLAAQERHLEDMRALLWKAAKP